jgi:outer membrane protein OmpA-like peptidoglycan-associated protein
MTLEFDYFRRRPAMRGATTVLATLIGAAWLAGAPANAQEKAAPSDVTVDYGVLDRLGSSNGESAPLPAPAEKPVSHVVAPGSSSGLSTLGGPTPPNVVPEGTSLAVPTSPMETTSLGDVAVPAPGGTTTDLSPGGAVASTEPLPPPPTPPGEAAAPTATAASESAPTATAPSETAPTTAAASETAPTATAPTAPTQSASVEPAAGTQPPPDAADQSTLIDGQLRIPYDSGSRGIPDAAKGKIDALIEKLHGEPSLRLQVLAYADGDSDEVTRARGLSLSRALAMRSYLVEHGIDMMRMDVRALGNTAQEEPADRVDLIPVPQ